MTTTNKYTFFWKDKDCFSNWFKSKITYDGLEFNCSEQLFMYRKAMFFGDEETAKEIVGEKSPRNQKALGRKVKNFDTDAWSKASKEIMYEVNKLKFTQDDDLLQKLIATGDTEICEASPYDLIWGCGLLETNPNIEDKTNWTGTNWLGEVLTTLRENIKNEAVENYVSKTCL